MMPSDAESATIAICSWENPWAKGGGLFAVVREYGSYIAAQQSRDVLVLTPMHELGGCPEGLENDLHIRVPFDGRIVDATVHKVTHSGVDWHLIAADSFFQADGGRSQTSPYAYSGDSIEPDESRQLRDALFFSRAVPQVLEALQKTHVLIHLQDWQTAPVTVAIQDRLASPQFRMIKARTVLTMHNPYDHGLSEKTWRMLTERPFPKDEVQTVYRRTLDLLDAPPATVSQEFARDLHEDTLQTLYFAHHLQPVFQERGVSGIDNGPFEKIANPFPDGVRLSVKQEKRARMLALLSEYQREESRAAGRLDGANGGPLTTLPDDVPVFMMVGRLDQRQKGFDVFARAIRNFVGPKNLDGRFIIATDPGDAPPSFLEDLILLGEEFAGQVLVCAFRMQKAYFECQAGATFSVWPSVYEPFGGVSEFFLKGTPAVARMTGGLRQQVFDIDASSDGTGIAYSTPPVKSRVEWKAVMDATSPGARERQPLYREQVRHLTDALVRARKAFHNDEVYDRMLGNLFPVCQRFSWERVWTEYSELYRQAFAS